MTSNMKTIKQVFFQAKLTEKLLVIITGKLDFNCIFIFCKWDTEQRMEKSLRRKSVEGKKSPFLTSKLLCSFFSIPQFFHRDWKQKFHPYKRVFLRHQRYEKTMNWKNFPKTYKKAVLVRFPDQRGLGKYLSQTSEQFEVCPFLFNTAA